MRFDELLRLFSGDIDLAFNANLVLQGLRVGMIMDRNQTCFIPCAFESAIKLATESGVSTRLKYVLSKDDRSLLLYNTDIDDVFTDDVLAQAFQMPAGLVYNQLRPEFCTVRENWFAESCRHFSINGVMFYSEKCPGEMNQSKIQEWVAEGRRNGLEIVIQECKHVSDRRFARSIEKCDWADIYVRKFDIAHKFWGDNFWQITGWLLSHACMSPSKTKDVCLAFGDVWRFILKIIQSGECSVNPKLEISQVRKMRDIIGDLEIALYHNQKDTSMMHKLWMESRPKLAAVAAKK